MTTRAPSSVACALVLLGAASACNLFDRDRPLACAADENCPADLPLCLDGVCVASPDDADAGFDDAGPPDDDAGRAADAGVEDGGEALDAGFAADAGGLEDGGDQDAGEDGGAPGDAGLVEDAGLGDGGAPDAGGSVADGGPIEVVADGLALGSGSVDVVVGSDGGVHVAWWSEGEAAIVYAQRGAGGSFQVETARAYSPTPAPRPQPAVFVHATGIPAIVARDGDREVLVAYARGGGGSWSTIDADIEAGSGLAPEVVHVEGVPVAVHSTGSALRAVRENGLLTFESGPIFAVASGGQFSIAAHGTTLGVVSFDFVNRDVRFSSGDPLAMPSPTTWIPSSDVDVDNRGADPSLAFDSAGDPVVLYRRADDALAIRGSALIGDAVVYGVPDNLSQGALAVDAQNVLHVAWKSASTDDGGIHCWTRGPAAADPVSDLRFDQNVADLAMALGPDGRAHVAYLKNAGGTFEVRHFVCPTP